jgi:SAM-dependent methyltransferase
MRRLMISLYKKLLPVAWSWSKRIYSSFTPPWARARLSIGVEPLSYTWGQDRGREIARYYLEELFLTEFREDIRGRCLEFNENRYTSRFGARSKITEIDILNLEDDNPATTIQADLTKPNSIPSDVFDCIICTHVLHVIYEFDQAIADLHRILKPGGVLLIAVPQTSMYVPGLNELWRFTQEGLNLALAKSFQPRNITMRTYGNSLTAAGEIRGLAAHEFTRRELHHHDVRFAVEVCARVMKAGREVQHAA